MIYDFHIWIICVIYSNYIYIYIYIYICVCVCVHPAFDTYEFCFKPNSAITYSQKLLELSSGQGRFY